jgi:hypothetical protein
MTRKQRARVVINLIRELALKHGDKNPRVEEDGSRTQIIHFHYDWSAVLSIGPTNPPVPPALFVEEPRKSKKIAEDTLPHWVRVSIFGIRVFVCEFDDEDVYSSSGFIDSPGIRISFAPSSCRPTSVLIAQPQMRALLISTERHAGRVGHVLGPDFEQPGDWDLRQLS